MSEVTEALAKTSLFRELSRKHLNLIARAAEKLDISAGTTLFTQGTPTSHMSIIISGQASVEVDGTMMAMLGPGDVIGELSLVDGKPSSATVTFTEDASIWHIARVGFVPVWNQNPEISKQMLLAVVERLRDTNERFAGT